MIQEDTFPAHEGFHEAIHHLCRLGICASSQEGCWWRDSPDEEERRRPCLLPAWFVERGEEPIVEALRSQKGAVMVLVILSKAYALCARAPCSVREAWVSTALPPCRLAGAP
jgi:hypothetical protein